MSDEPERPGDAPEDAPSTPDAARAEDEAPEEATPACAECGAELADDQTYCLECGTPTPRAPRLSRGGRAGLILAGALVIFGLGAGALAYAVINDDNGGGGGSTTAQSTGFPTVTTDEYTIPTDAGTGPLPPDTSGFPVDTGLDPTDTSGLPIDTAPSTDDFPTYTEQPADTETDTDTDTEPVEPVDPDTGSGASDWPEGESAWTAIVSSTTSESEARATAERLADAGEESGVLFSSDHPGLRAGYWVVFSGSFATRDEASAHARALGGSFPGAYPRHVEG